MCRVINQLTFLSSPLQPLRLNNWSSAVLRILFSMAICSWDLLQSYRNHSKSSMLMAVRLGVPVVTPVAHPLHRLTNITHIPNFSTNLSAMSLKVFIWFHSLLRNSGLLWKPVYNCITIATIIGHHGYINRRRCFWCHATCESNHRQHRYQVFNVHHVWDVWFYDCMPHVTFLSWVWTECRDYTTPPHGGVGEVVQS